MWRKLKIKRLKNSIICYNMSRILIVSTFPQDINNNNNNKIIIK